MKKIYIFGKQTCPVCKDAYEKFCYFKEKKGFDAPIEYVDMDTVDGMAEGAFYEVSDIPTIIIFEDENEVVRWAKKPPVSEEFLPYLSK
uniref:Thioredoxin n=1 Tax=candidate division WOR-3 bacterium TaxID=2052148 RepID=A0A7C6EGT0_UNCW3